ncbi:LysM peptidoglycan-binding domain-containing protein [Helicobacter sp. MIT 05-5293]|uniref:lytic transglycosylase domain-containing protein n=1 Tax=Helicobacter sp. MIT 05-5293 TaxID=1548149 RepID=UPI0010FE221E|nr:lytic transglycosylase domain-containing protein [Helicobacter sp. MIT 05-5293]TLD79809.1 LysM peptidoglycan-binding domain-containing protein [Helicobacter sp. MIT 05-5293]
MKILHLLRLTLISLLCANLCWGEVYEGFYTMTHDKNTNKVLNSFGVRTAFITTMADDEKAQKILEKWQYFVNKFDSSYEFIPILKSAMAREEIPQEFLFLAMVESGFTPTAKSSKKAIGIWQIMPATAKGLGLEINSYIDERKDPIKSTEAAIKYLKYLYDATGEWYLAAMAYNCGLGRLKRGIDEAGGDTRIETLLNEEAQYIPAETRNYIRKILAMSLLFNNIDLLKGQNVDYLLNRGATDSIVTVNVKGGVALSSIAKSAKMSLRELQKYNKHFTRSVLPPGNKQYNVYLPYDKLRFFKQNFNAKSQSDSMFITHKVQKGETLSSIAQIYRVSIQDLQAVNHIKGSLININQTLTIPILKAKNNTIADGRS